MMSYEENLNEARHKISIDSTFAGYRDNLMRYQTETNNEAKKRNQTQNKQVENKDGTRTRTDSLVPTKDTGNKFVAPKQNMPIIDKVS